NKYPFLNPQAGGGAEHVCPARIDETLTRQIQDLALRAYRSIGLRVYSRVDVLLPENAAPTVLEVNTIPGMTEASLLPEAAAAAEPGGGRRVNASLAGTASRTCKSVPLRTDCAARGKHSSRCAGGAEQMSLSRSTRKRSRNQRVSNPRQRKQQHLLDVKVRSR